MAGPEGETRIGASADLGDVPDWVPVYPGAAETQGTYTSKTAQGVAGMVAAKTADGRQQVADYYQEWFEDNGYEIKTTSTNTTPDGSISTFSAELAAEGRSLTVGIVEQGGEVNVSLTYNVKAE